MPLCRVANKKKRQLTLLCKNKEKDDSSCRVANEKRQQLMPRSIREKTTAHAA
jgi:hypothetical protein